MLGDPRSNVELINITDIGDKIRKHLDNDYDAWGVADGPEGKGKSTFLIQLGIIIDPDFDIIENVIYRKRERYEKLTSRDKGQALIDDEGMRDYYKQFWNTSEQKKANIIYSQSRQTNIFVGIAIPRFIDLNIYLRSWRVRNWFHIPRRSRFWYSHIDDSPFVKDPWHLDNLEIHLERNRVGEGGETMNFSDLPDKFKIPYRAEKKKAFYEQIKELMDAGEDGELSPKQIKVLNDDKVGSVDRLIAETGWTQKKCCGVIGISTKTYQRRNK